LAIIEPHPTLSKGEGSESGAASKVLSFGEDLGEAKAAFAVIFDMDGTLIDNTPYHFKSWQALFKKYGKGELTKQTYYIDISGVPVMETIRRIFGDEYDEAGLKDLLNEKEDFYRKEYAPFVAPINGLENFLTELKNAGVKMAMATSATVQDINFIMDRIPIRNDFNAIVNSSMVSKPKPNPQIFLKAAERLNMPPEKCVVFEDSLAGIKAANSAGMKVVAITTGHTAAELHPVNIVINDYSELTVQKLAKLFEKQ
jgi:beta-phosphoglucomutase